MKPGMFVVVIVNEMFISCYVVLFIGRKQIRQQNKNQDGNISRCTDSRIKNKMGISLDVRPAE